MRAVVLILLLLAVAVCAAEYKIIQQDEQGRFYLDERAVIEIANYIKRLEELNANYKLQITNLEQQVQNLKEQIALYEEMKKGYETQISELNEKIAKLEARQTWQWIVVAVVTVGSLVLVFVK